MHHPQKQKCITPRSRCAPPPEADVHHPQKQMCITPRSRSAPPPEADVHHPQKQMCTTPRSRCAPPPEADVQRPILHKQVKLALVYTENPHTSISYMLLVRQHNLACNFFTSCKYSATECSCHLSQKYARKFKCRQCEIAELILTDDCCTLRLREIE